MKILKMVHIKKKERKKENKKEKKREKRSGL